MVGLNVFFIQWFHYTEVYTVHDIRTWGCFIKLVLNFVEMKIVNHCRERVIVISSTTGLVYFTVILVVVVTVILVVLLFW